jgi:hypothetical protein
VCRELYLSVCVCVRVTAWVVCVVVSECV